MTVAELIEELQKVEDRKRVVNVRDQYGRWREAKVVVEKIGYSITGKEFFYGTHLNKKPNPILIIATEGDNF